VLSAALDELDPVVIEKQYADGLIEPVITGRC